MATVEDFVEHSKQKASLNPLSKEDMATLNDVRQGMEGTNPALRVVPKHNPQQARDALKLSRESGVPAEVAIDQRDDVLAERDRRDLKEIEAQSPSFAHWMAKNEINHAAGKDDVKSMTGIEGFFRNIGQSYENGGMMIELAELARIPLWGGTLTPEQRKKKAELKRLLSHTKEYETGIITGVPSAVAEQLPIFGTILKKGLVGAGVGAGAGAGVGLIGGPVGVGAGALAGATIGMRAASALAAADLESSLAFDEYQEIKDRDGNQVDMDTARGAAILVGIVNGSLEMVGLSAITRTVPGLSNLTRGGAKRLLREATKSAAFRSYAKAVGMAVAGEGVTEGLQELMTTAGKELLELHNDDRLKGMDTEDILGQIFSNENLKRYAEAAKKGAQAGGGITVVTGGVQTGVNLQQQRKKRQQFEEEFEAFNELARESKIKNENPDQMGDIIDDVMKDGDNTAYVDPSKFEEYFQSQEINPNEAADGIMGDGAAELAAAKEEGRDMQIPISSYINNVAGGEHGEFFQSETKFSPDENTLEETDQTLQEIETQEKEEAKRVTKEEKALNKLEEKLEKQLRETGHTGQLKKGNLAIAKALIHTAATRSGIPIEKFMERFELGLRAGDISEVLSRMKESVDESLWQKFRFIHEDVTGEATPEGFGNVVGFFEKISKEKEQPNVLLALRHWALDEVAKGENILDQIEGLTAADVVAAKEILKKDIKVDAVTREEMLYALDILLDLKQPGRQRHAAHKRVLRALLEKKKERPDLYQRLGEKEDMYMGRILFDPKERGKQRRQFTVEFFKDANSSTFIHEMGHYTLEVMQDLSGQKDADATIAEDFKKIREFVGAEGNAPFTVEQHEKFAEAMEAYVKEGKAPSKDLRAVFARFKNWLKRIYQQLRRQEVDLTDDVRGVFDRLFATDEAIAEARGQFGDTPLFTDMKAAGFTDTQAVAYQNLVDGVESDVLESVEKKQQEKIKREQSKWWQEEKEIVKERIRKELNEDRGYTALFGLTKAELPDGTPTEPIKIAKASLREIYSKEEIKGMPKIYTSKKGEGVEASIVADFFGFDSVEDMINTLKELRPFEEVVEERAESYMQENFAEDQRVEMRSAVDDALHAESRERILRMEIKQMFSTDFAKAAGLTKKIAGTVSSSEVMAQQAREIIAGKSIRSISPAVYQRAQQKASKKALDAFLKGDVGAALSQKKKQLLSFHLWKEATRVRKDVEKGIKYLKRFEKRPLRERIGKAGGGYLEQIDGVLERVSLRPISQREARKRKGLLAWAKEKQEQGEPLLIPDKLLTLAAQVDYRDLLSSDFTDAVDTIKHMEALARLKNTLITEQGKRDLAKTIGGMVQTIRQFHKPKRDPHDYNPSALKKSLDIIDSYIAQHKKVEFITNMLDGNKAFGSNWRAIFQPMVEASDYRNKLTEQGSKGIEDAFSHYSKKEMAELYTKKINVPTVGTLTKQQIITVGLHMRNDYNREALLEGEGWDSVALNHVLSLLTAKDIEAINKIGDVLETYWPLVEKQEKEILGIAPKKVRGEDFETPAGIIKGGYTPIIFDPSRSSQQEKIEERNNVLDLYGSGYAIAMTQRGHTKERTNTAGKPFLLDLSMLSRHIEQVSHDLAYRVPVINVNKILNNELFRETVETTLGKNTFKQLTTWLHATAANQEAQSIGKVGRFLSYIRQGSTVAVMGLSLRTSLLQPLGYLVSAKELGYRWAFQGLWKTYANPAKTWKLYNDVREKSSFMRNRFNTVNRDVADALRKLDKSGKNVRNEIVGKFFFPIGAADMLVSLPTWLAGYEKALSGNVEKIEALNEKEAIEYADSLIRITQGDGAVQNLAAVQRGDEMGRLYTMYMSYFAVVLNQFIKITGQAKMDGVKGAIPVLNAFFLTQLMPEFMSELLLDRMDEEEKESPAFYVLKTGLKAPLRGFVGIRDVVSFMEYRDKGGRFAPSPLIGDVEKLGRVIEAADRLIRDEKDFDELTRRDVRSAIDLVGVIAQLPTAQAWRTSEYLWRYLNGDEQPDNVGELLYRAMLTGPKREKK